MNPPLSETKICVEKIFAADIHEIDEINSSINNPGLHKKLKAAFLTKKIWPAGSDITIAFLGKGDNVKRTNLSSSTKEVDPLQKEVESLSVQDAIKKIVYERIQPIVDLNFSFVDHPSKAIIRISFDKNAGAWSLVGTDNLLKKEGATMNLGWFDVPTTLHEFGHLLGLVHEHQNPKGKKIMWDEPKVLEWAKETQGWSDDVTKENIINKYEEDTINGGDFDPLSIMLYFFPSSLTTNNTGTEQNLRLSGEDVVWLNKIYHKEDGVTPEEFYEKTYKTSLQSSLDKSKKMAAEFGGSDTSKPSDTTSKPSDTSNPNTINNIANQLKLDWKTISIASAFGIFFVVILLLWFLLR